MEAFFNCTNMHRFWMYVTHMSSVELAKRRLWVGSDTREVKPAPWQHKHRGEKNGDMIASSIIHEAKLTVRSLCVTNRSKCVPSWRWLFPALWVVSPQVPDLHNTVMLCRNACVTHQYHNHVIRLLSDYIHIRIMYIKTYPSAVPADAILLFP